MILKFVCLGNIICTGQSRYYAPIGVHESHSRYTRDSHLRVQKKKIKKKKKKIFFFFFGAKAETSLSGPENLHPLVSVLQCILCFQRITYLSQLYLSQCGWGIPCSGEVLGLFKFQ